MLRYPEGDKVLAKSLPHLPQVITSSLGKKVLVLPIVDKLDLPCFHRLMKHLSTREQDEDILCLFNSGGGNRSTGEKLTYSLNAHLQLELCRVVSFAAGTVCSTALDIWMGINNPDQRYCSLYTRFLAHNSTHSLSAVPGKANLVDDTFNGLTPRQVGRKIEKECLEILEQERAMSLRWNAVARKMGFASAAEFLRAEITIRPDKALKLGMVTKIINLPEVHLSRE